MVLQSLVDLLRPFAEFVLPLAFFGFFAIVWLMRVASVARVGKRVYRYVADNRGRQFTCRVDLEK